MADFNGIAAAVRNARTEDLEAISALQRQVAAATTQSLAGQDTVHSEQLLTCILESFIRGGADSQEVLSQVLLEILPHLAELAGVSAVCAQTLSEFCSLAAQACPPRDSITAFLEVMDQLLSSSHSNAAERQFMYSLLELLPQLLTQLNRRKAAFVTECLLPIVKLARVCGEVLGTWMLGRLKLTADAMHAAADIGARDSTADTLGHDSFLAANWQQYVDFVECVLHKALPGEDDPAARESCKRAVGNSILHMLLHLTASWPPPMLTPIVLQLLQSTAPAAVTAQLPTAASIVQPTSMFSAPNMQHGSLAQGSMPWSSSNTQQPEQHRQHVATSISSDAVAVVQSLLRLLQECGFSDWHQLMAADADAAGAALAALYSGCLQSSDCSLDTLPGSKVDTLKSACRWCSVLVEASLGNPLVVLKAIALVQLAATHALALPELLYPSAATSTTHHHPHLSLKQEQQQQQQAHSYAVESLTAAEFAEQLLPHVKPCVTILASCIASGSAILRSQASLAMQQLLKAPGLSVSYECLKNMLSADGGGQIHPEVAALLMQEVRVQLVAATPGSYSPFAGGGSVSLVLPWLQQYSIAGWRDTEQLAHRANAICVALAVARLSLLTIQQQEAARAAADGRSDRAQLEKLLREPLTALSAAVVAALDALQADNSQEQGLPQLQRLCAQPNSVAEEQRVKIPGDAAGAGEAVDAWLAVSRLQDVLDRVMELL